jgi:hypothetical protein
VVVTAEQRLECRLCLREKMRLGVEAAASVIDPSIGMIHLFTDNERQQSQGGAAASFAAGSFGGPAKPGAPNVGWAMAYGAEYLPEVDVSRIKAAGFPVDKRDSFVVVRVTENLSDVVDDFPHFSRRRAELKSLFRPDLFWIKDEPLLDA